MAANNRLDQLKSQIERLGRDSVDVVGNANRVVYKGIQKLAEQELKALNDYYKGAIDSLKSTRKGSSLKDVAAKQIDLMQETVNRVISHARESMSIIADTRSELAKLVDRSEEPAGPKKKKKLVKAAAPAQKAIKNVRAAAVKAQKDMKKTVKATRKAVVREVKKGRDAGRAKAEQVAKLIKQRVGSVLDIQAPPPAPAKPVSARPSPTSRASRATSMAKRALSRAQIAVKPV